MDVSSADLTVHAWVNFTTTTGGSPRFDPGCDMSIVDKMVNGAAEVNGDGWRLLKQFDDRSKPRQGE